MGSSLCNEHTFIFDFIEKSFRFKYRGMEWKYLYVLKCSTDIFNVIQETANQR